MTTFLQFEVFDRGNRRLRGKLHYLRRQVPDGVRLSSGDHVIIGDDILEFARVRESWYDIRSHIMTFVLNLLTVGEDDFIIDYLLQNGWTVEQDTYAVQPDEQPVTTD